MLHLFRKSDFHTKKKNIITYIIKILLILLLFILVQICLYLYSILYNIVFSIYLPITYLQHPKSLMCTYNQTNYNYNIVHYILNSLN